MTHAKLNAMLETLCETLRLTVTKHIPPKGDKEESCQRLTILNRLNDLEHAINGITEDDLQGHEQETL